MNNSLLHSLTLLAPSSRSVLLAVLCPVPLMSFAWLMFTL